MTGGVWPDVPGAGRSQSRVEGAVDHPRAALEDAGPCSTIRLTRGRHPEGFPKRQPRALFWDVDAATLDLPRHSRSVIKPLGIIDDGVAWQPSRMTARKPLLQMTTSGCVLHDHLRGMPPMCCSARPGRWFCGSCSISRSAGSPSGNSPGWGTSAPGLSKTNRPVLAGPTSSSAAATGTLGFPRQRLRLRPLSGRGP